MYSVGQSRNHIRQKATLGSADVIGAKVSKVIFSIMLEREMGSLSGEAKDTGERFVSDPHKAAVIAVEIANRPGKLGGSVIICVRRQSIGAIGYLSLVEPGDSIADVECDIREKSTR